VARPASVPAQAPTPAAGLAAIPADYVPEPERALARVPDHVFLDGNYLSFHPQQAASTLVVAQTKFNETATSTVSYAALPRLQSGSVNIAVLMGAHVAAGVRVLLPRYTQFAGLTARVPHPTLFNRFASDVGVSGPLERKDLMLDLAASYVVNQPRWRAIVSGGPSYFHTSLDLVSGIAYAQNFTLAGLNVVTVTGDTTTHQTASTWGFNVGGDVAAFPWRHVGVGGGLLFNKGTIQVDDPFTLTSQDLDMSSVTLLVGPRLRF
jgi:hypothetical protein